LYLILEEILAANGKQLRQKNIEVNKTYEKDLPDTFIHPEQVRFILNSVLQYAIFSTPPNGTIDFLLKSSDSETIAEKTSNGSNRGYVEVILGLNGDRKPFEQSENLSGTPNDQEEMATDLVLRLAKEILERNCGRMIKTHGKRSKTFVAMGFPIERRKVVYYEPIAL
jgi:hypothetical protein